MATPKTYAVLRSDLALTRYVGAPSSVPLDAADSWGTLDVVVAPSVRSAAARRTPGTDVGVVSGRANLAQALVLRLLTRQGSLAALGHPDYGSRLTELIGGLNNETTRNLARLYTIQAVRQEPRVRRLLELSVQTLPDQPQTIRVGFAVLPVDDDDPLALSLEVAL